MASGATPSLFGRSIRLPDVPLQGRLRLGRTKARDAHSSPLHSAVRRLPRRTIALRSTSAAIKVILTIPPPPLGGPLVRHPAAFLSGGYLRVPVSPIRPPSLACPRPNPLPCPPRRAAAPEWSRREGQDQGRKGVRRRDSLRRFGAGRCVMGERHGRGRGIGVGNVKGGRDVSPRDVECGLLLTK